MNMKIVALLVSVTCLVSCKTAYYGAMEKVGKEKRDIMSSRVVDARDAQHDAKDEFADALEQFSAVVDVDGGDLERNYKKLSKSFQKSEQKATDVNARIVKVESVSKDLFKEWQSEMKQYSSSDLRRASQQQFDVTQKSYQVMITSMKDAAAKMDPVLAAFRDQVLFLKHNLNARAISSIQNEARKVEQDVAALIKDMEASIAEADAFISELNAQ